MALGRLQMNAGGQSLNKPQGTSKELHAWKLKDHMDQLPLPLSDWHIVGIKAFVHTIQVRVDFASFRGRPVSLPAHLPDRFFAGNLKHGNLVF